MMVNSHPQYVLALQIAEKAHENQFRFDGKTPYVNHVKSVANRVERFNNYKISATALLHDVLEDNAEYTAQKLIELGIEKEIVDAVVALTKTKTDDYLKTYLPRVKANKIARIVKIADMTDNLSGTPTKRQKERYTAGLKFLA